MERGTGRPAAEKVARPFDSKIGMGKRSRESRKNGKSDQKKKTKKEKWVIRKGSFGTVVFRSQSKRTTQLRKG